MNNYRIYANLKRIIIHIRKYRFEGYPFYMSDNTAWLPSQNFARAPAASGQGKGRTKCGLIPNHPRSRRGVTLEGLG